MEKDQIDKLRNRIWITERCHMNAEIRNRYLEYYFHITLALFALSSIFIALFQNETNVSSFENILTFTTICTLSISLLIFGFSFGEVAAQHRSCYLDLQRLRIEDSGTEGSLNARYINTLSYVQDWPSKGLCCTNRVKDVFPLPPDGLSLQAQ